MFLKLTVSILKQATQKNQQQNKQIKTTTQHKHKYIHIFSNYISNLLQSFKGNLISQILQKQVNIVDFLWAIFSQINSNTSRIVNNFPDFSEACE